MISAALYLLILSRPQFGCPLTSARNCQGTGRCSSCYIFNTTTNNIVRFQNEILKKDLPPCNGGVSFPSDKDRQKCQQIDCSQSTLECAVNGFRPDHLEICPSCVVLEPQFIVQFAVSIMLFPLGVLFMTCNLLAWRSDSSDEMQLSRESESQALSIREKHAAEVGRNDGSVSSISLSTLDVIQKLETTLKGLSTLNQFVKYIAQTTVFFLILLFSRPSCNPTSPSGTSSAQLTELCNPEVNIQTELFVMGCCAVIFLALLIFDFIVIRRNRLKNVAEPIAITVVTTCVILMIICSVQLVQVLNSEVRFICVDSQRVQSYGNFNIELSRYICPAKNAECRSCETSIPSSAKIVASSIVLDMLFVIFGAVGYAHSNNGVMSMDSVKLMEIKSS